MAFGGSDSSSAPAAAAAASACQGINGVLSLGRQVCGFLKDGRDLPFLSIVSENTRCFQKK